MNTPKIMVCTTRQKTCERLIEAGKRIAQEHGGQVHVVHVAKTGANFLDNPDEAEALEYLFQISKTAGAEMSVLRSDNAIKTLAKFAEENEISTVVMGESPDSNGETIIRKMERLIPNKQLIVIPAQ